MSAVVKPNSVSPQDQLTDIKTFLAKGELDLTDFYEGSAGDGLARAVMGIYYALNNKLDINRQEAFMSSAQRDRSIQYLAISQNNYNPFRNIAPQHIRDDSKMIWTSPNNIIFNSLSTIAEAIVDEEGYSISVISDLIPIVKTDETTTWQAKGCIGEWKTVEIEIDPSKGDYDRFKNFTISEDVDVIDDSKTIKISIQSGNGQSIDMSTERDLINIAYLSKEESAGTALVKSNPFGGIDINFGDGVVFGAGIPDTGEISSLAGNVLERQQATKVTVSYLTTPGRIMNLNFDTIKFNEATVTEIVRIDLMENGVGAESTDKIKTLSPAHSVTLNKIITADDMTAIFSRFGGVISAYSVQEQPDGASVWDSTVLYSRGDIVLYNGVYYINTTGYLPGSGSVPGVSYYWLPLTAVDPRRNNATITLYALVEDSTSSDIITPLTEAIFFDRYYEIYNLPARLGFLQVKIGTPIETPIEFTMTVVLKNLNDPSIIDTTQNNTTTAIENILNKRLNKLSAFISVGDIVNEITDLTAVDKVYLKSPAGNRQLQANQYAVASSINITYEFSDNAAFGFGE